MADYTKVEANAWVPGGVPFYIARRQYAVWKNTKLIIDVVPGRGGMVSLDNGREKRFLTRSEICALP